MIDFLINKKEENIYSKNTVRLQDYSIEMQIFFSNAIYFIAYTRKYLIKVKHNYLIYYLSNKYSYIEMEHKLNEEQCIVSLI